MPSGRVKGPADALETSEQQKKMDDFIVVYRVYRGLYLGFIGFIWTSLLFRVYRGLYYPVMWGF